MNSVTSFWGLLFAIIGTPFYAVLPLTAVLRLFVRRCVWIADLAAAAVASIPSFAIYKTAPSNLSNGTIYLFLDLTLRSLLRRFGLLAVFAGTLTDALISGCPDRAPILVRGRGLVIRAIPALAAARGLWTVVSRQRQPVGEPAA